MSAQPENWQPYWTAALARHKARIAAGCVSAVGAIRVGKGRVELDDETDDAARRPREAQRGGEGE